LSDSNAKIMGLGYPSAGKLVWRKPTDILGFYLRGFWGFLQLQSCNLRRTDKEVRG